jgi:hypothetical protein
MASGANQLRRLLQEGRSTESKRKSGNGKAAAAERGVKTSDSESACNV